MLSIASSKPSHNNLGTHKKIPYAVVERERERIIRTKCVILPSNIENVIVLINFLLIIHSWHLSEKILIRMNLIDKFILLITAVELSCFILSKIIPVVLLPPTPAWSAKTSVRCRCLRMTVHSFIIHHCYEFYFVDYTTSIFTSYLIINNGSASMREVT